LPKVFESIGILGNIIEFFFFMMVTIAAITSVISIMEVASQFVIQKFGISRKIATAAIALITFAVAVPVSISLGHLLNGSTKMTVFGLDWLSFLDTVTNTVFMPICAFLSCVTVGWFIGSKQALAELKADGNSFGKLGTFVGVMIKYIVPALILLIEIFGVVDLIFPQGAFSLNGLGVVLIAYGLFALLIGAYFLFLRKGETGTNADEAA
jgi:NSS family neurotransmitter:Na+ symporter